MYVYIDFGCFDLIFVFKNIKVLFNLIRICIRTDVL